MIEYFGETENLLRGGWILPDGAILDFGNTYGNYSGIGRRHSLIYDALRKDRQKTLAEMMPEHNLLYGDDSLAIDLCVAAGMIRYYLSDRRSEITAYFQLEKVPTPK